jgi:hypothetical protein
LLCKLLGVRPTADVSAAPAEIKNHWGAAYLWSAVNTGLMTGDGKAYRPDDPVTRAELAAFCAKGLHVPNTIDYSQAFFPDVAPPMWFNDAVVTMRIHSVMSGMPDGTFRPHWGATRAEAASVIYKMLNTERKDFSSFRSRNMPPRNDFIIDPR